MVILPGQVDEGRVSGLMICCQIGDGAGRRFERVRFTLDHFPEINAVGVALSFDSSTVDCHEPELSIQERVR